MEGSISLANSGEREGFMHGSQLMRRVKTLLKSLLMMLSGTSKGYTRQLPSEVQPDELLSTFVVRPDHIVKKSNSVHYSRLMPRRRDKKPNGRLETSVCRSLDLTESRVWEICSKFFDKYAPKPAIGRGIGPVEAVTARGLGFDADGKPYPEHTNIIGWQDSAVSQTAS